MEKIRTEGGDHVVINTVSAEATVDEVSMYASKHIDRWMKRDVIWDLTRADFAGVTVARLREVIAQTEHISEKRHGFRTAMVAQSDLGYGLMRMFSMLSERRYKSHVEAFRALEEARAWLSSIRTT